jgi:hypothetical protein
MVITVQQRINVLQADIVKKTETRPTILLSALAHSFHVEFERGE